MYEKLNPFYYYTISLFILFINNELNTLINVLITRLFRVHIYIQTPIVDDWWLMIDNNR